MINRNTDNNLAVTAERLKNANISLYKIASTLEVPRSTVYKIFAGKIKYSENRINVILEKINNYLNELEGIQMEKELKSDIMIPGKSDCPEIFENYDLYIRLFELGLNARAFNPEEKLRFAIWHRTLTAFKGKEKQEDS